MEVAAVETVGVAVAVAVVAVTEEALLLQTPLLLVTTAAGRQPPLSRSGLTKLSTTSTINILTRSNFLFN